MRSGMTIGMEFFIGKMKKEQMSGRPYLKTQTGNLKRSWFVKSGIAPGIIWASTATRTKYAAIHQFGGTIRPKTKDYLSFTIGKKFVKTKQVHIPKRLYLFEHFKLRASKTINQKVWQALRVAYR